MPTKLFLALDFDKPEDARNLFRQTLALNPYFKIGLELFTAAGPDFVRELSDAGGQIFLDLKFHDIPNTVAKAVSRSVEMGAKWLNVHCAGGAEMLSAAVTAKKETSAKLGLKTEPSLLGVTVLTSLSDQLLQEIGYSRSSAAQVEHFAKLAQNSGLDGIVCSAQELDGVQKSCGKNFLTMIPGIRPLGTATDDQKRTMTPGEAAKAGAHYIVVGRPITRAKDPLAALTAILGEL